jgi:hypothetical protein
LLHPNEILTRSCPKPNNEGISRGAVLAFNKDIVELLGVIGIHRNVSRISVEAAWREVGDIGQVDVVCKRTAGHVSKGQGQKGQTEELHAIQN